MLMADGDTSNFWSGGDAGIVGGGGDLETGYGGEYFTSDDDFNMSIDLDAFNSILGEDADDPQELSPEDYSFQNLSQGVLASTDSNHDNFLLPGLQGFEETPPLGAYLPEKQNNFFSCGSEPSEFRAWGSELFLDPVGNFNHGNLSTQNERQDCSNAYGFPEGVVNNIPEWPDNAYPTNVRANADTKFMPYVTGVEYVETSQQNYDFHNDSSMSAVRAPEDNSCTSAEMPSGNAIHNEANTFQVSENLCSDFNPAMQYAPSMDGIPFTKLLSDDLTAQYIQTIESMLDDEEEFPADNVCLNGNLIATDQFGRSARHAPPMSKMDSYSLKKLKYESDYSMSPFDGIFSSNESLEPSTQNLDRANQIQESCVKQEGSNKFVTSHSSNESMEEAVTNSVVSAADDKTVTDKELKHLFPGYQPHISRKKDVVHTKDEKAGMLFPSKIPSKRTFGSKVVLDEVNRNSSKGGSMIVPKFISTKKQVVHIKNEKEGRVILAGSMGSHYSKSSTITIESSPMSKSPHVVDIDDDNDICILEDISMPPRPIPSLGYSKQLVSTQRSPPYDSLHHIGDGGTRHMANDERNIYRVALQDLSQPTSEATPPEGVLAVSLLRHQKIALSWMVQKETASLFCSGGILADDQGLGKTISTIALILKERSPSSKALLNCREQKKLETLNLEDDDDIELDGTKDIYASVPTTGRIAAGTLVVCPTSVLRQWAEELHSKVTEKANLSVLVYHGSNRTKDPCELAKYDVVVTTYSIVSMEVPKQPLVDKDDEDKKKEDARFNLSMEFASRKRKYPPNSGKRGKKKIEKDLLESTARPLAKVGWFRVVLDEAQSIKNHKTQAARACWGLRAKRRWCLSGTPIQNAIDDLYSYFRFLRYDPYAVYKTFCSTIKVPITKNPTNGYKKLQAVLKTIMLRRTKGSFLDGEPIINLPPKSIELKRVDFSKEERDFYSRLEAESRAQFEEYAAAGTVKQNYVNILLMLLRLRQACDHPLLVKGCNSKSIWRSSVETANKFSQDKRAHLLTCLEASLAICGICNDPPEDAAVSICGHVFCNQCICEHLTGDDNQCPSRGCKVKLSVSLVFSKATLSCSLDAQSPQENNLPGSSGCAPVQTTGCSSDDLCFDSSKIKAALQVLQSLSKPRNVTVRSSSLKTSDETTISPEKLSESQSLVLPMDIPEKANGFIDLNIDMDGCSNRVEGEKAIVFSQWTSMLDLLEACLKTSSIQYRRLDGTMSVLARDKAVKDFNTLPEVSVMIMSLKAASLGLNMVAACHVVLLDLWWNPTTEDQAIDRAHRIGQTRPVTVLRLTVKDTVEDRILALQQKKREMVASAFGEDETGSRQTRLTVEDLNYLFMV